MRGSAILTKARLCPPLHVRILTLPTALWFAALCPFLNSLFGLSRRPFLPLFHGTCSLWNCPVVMPLSLRQAW